VSGSVQSGSRFEVVTLLASLGGLAAFTEILRALPPTFPARVLVVQHGTRDDGRVAAILRTRAALPVQAARTGTRLDTGPGITVVPAGCSATLDADRSLTVTDLEPAQSGNILLTSLAPIVGRGLIAAVLTGRLSDGARGVRAVKRHGGRVLAQDPDTARANGMPTAAVATGCVDFVLPLHRIAQALVSLVMAPGGADLLTVAPPSWARLHA
jgi:two-component system, chemotaxis family, protein-glutamate methylesterase/glutaminase